MRDASLQADIDAFQASKRIVNRERRTVMRVGDVRDDGRQVANERRGTSDYQPAHIGVLKKRRGDFFEFCDLRGMTLHFAQVRDEVNRRPANFEVLRDKMRGEDPDFLDRKFSQDGQVTNPTFNLPPNLVRHTPSP